MNHTRFHCRVHVAVSSQCSLPLSYYQWRQFHITNEPCSTYNNNEQIKSIINISLRLALVPIDNPIYWKELLSMIINIVISLIHLFPVQTPVSKSVMDYVG